MSFPCNIQFQNMKSYWHKFLKENKWLLAILGLGIFLRLFWLDKIPGEMWADIVDGYEFTKRIITGEWPLYFVLGNGPLFFYFAAIMSLLFGLSFLTLKLTSVAIGMVLIIGSYSLTKELFNKKIALLTALFIAISKWSLIYSRWGNMNILVPAFVSFIFYFLYKAYKTGKGKYFIIVGVLTGIGLYNYPAFLFVPFTIGIIFVYFLIFKRTFIVRHIKYISLSLVLFLILSIPFTRMINQFAFFDSNSYFGSKIFTQDKKLPAEFMEKIGNNIAASFKMFYIKGDSSFRANISEKPHIDFVSSIFLLIGFVYLYKRFSFKGKFLFLLLPLITLQLPMILVVNSPFDVPSATRSIGILPFVYILIAYGFDSAMRLIKTRSIRLITILFLAAIFILNLYQVFIEYPKGLPNHNVPFDRVIALEIDKLSRSISVYVIGCCWGEWGQPDTRAIKYRLNYARKYEYLPPNELQNVSCNSFTDNATGSSKKAFVIDPKLTLIQKIVQNCFPGGTIKKIEKNEYKIAWFYVST